MIQEFVFFFSKLIILAEAIPSHILLTLDNITILYPHQILWYSLSVHSLPLCALII